MGRKRGQLDLKNETKEVASRFKKEKTLWKRERLQAIRLLLETVAQVFFCKSDFISDVKVGCFLCFC